MDEELTPNGFTDEQEGSVDAPAEPAFLVIGRAVRPHGVRGEVRVEIYSELPERFTWLEEVYLANDPDRPWPRPVAVEKARLHKGRALVKLAGYDGRDAAESLRGLWLLVTEEEAIPLEEGEYYLYQIEGMAVVTDEGEELGTLVEVLETNANHVFIVEGPRGEVLLPDTDEVVKEIDFDAGRMTVHLLPGLLP